jgi:ribosome-binding protein aMBF1 (putative translation factor)
MPRIEVQRGYEALSTKDGEDVPIAHDVVHEFVVEEVRKGEAYNAWERKLAAQVIGNRLRSARERRGITYHDLASRVKSWM